jgi:hypothetical protein
LARKTVENLSASTLHSWAELLDVFSASTPARVLGLDRRGECCKHKGNQRGAALHAEPSQPHSSYRPADFMFYQSSRAWLQDTGCELRAQGLDKSRDSRLTLKQFYGLENLGSWCVGFWAKTARRHYKFLIEFQLRCLVECSTALRLWLGSCRHWSRWELGSVAYFVPQAASADGQKIYVVINQIGYIGPAKPRVHPGAGTRLLLYGVE